MEDFFYLKIGQSKMTTLNRLPLPPLPPPLPGSFPETVSIPPPATPQRVMFVETAQVIPTQTPQYTPQQSVAPPPPPSPRRTVTLPPEVKTAEVKEYTGSIPDLEQVLLKYGYTVTEKVVIRDQDNGTVAKYVKTIDPNGQKVYVVPDVQALVPVPSNQTPLVPSRDVTIQPYSLKNGLMESAGLDVWGIAFECHNGVCTLVRNGSDLRPSEESFINPTLPRQQDNPITYPIVRMSEIQANPGIVLQNTQDVSMRLRNMTYERASLELRKNREAVRGLGQAFADYDKAQSQALASVRASLNELESYKKAYIKNPPVTPKDQIKYRQIIENIHIRHEMIADILQNMEAAEIDRSYLEEYTRKLQGLTQGLQDDLNYVNYVL